MNNKIFFDLYSLSRHSIAFDKIIVFITDPFIYIMIVIISLYFLFDIKDLYHKVSLSFIWEKIKNFIPIFLTGILAWGLGDLLKLFFKVDRPFVVFPQVQSLVSETGFSFPSLHSTLISALAFAVFFKNKKFGYVCLFVALLIGLSRIIVGVHFPLDVFGGFILGFIVAFVVHKFSKK